MFPAAPDVEIYAPTTLFAGRRVTIEVVVTPKKLTHVDFIDVRLRGHQGWRIGSGKSAVSARAVFPDLVARVMSEGELTLDEGTKRFPVVFELPAQMPPSHQEVPAWAYVELRVHVSIPWWPDGRYRFTLPVRLPPPAQVTRKPIALRSTSSPDAPRLELSLASTQLIAGETVVGSVAVFHLDDRKPRTVGVNIVPSFNLLRFGRIRERRGRELTMAVTIPAGTAGTSVPFQFRLPGAITPSFETVTHTLEWWLVAKTGSFFGAKADVAVALEIFDASAAATTRKLETPPILSDERVTRAFDAFARSDGWTTVDDEHTQLAIEKSELHIAYSYRGQAGTFLVSRIRHSLGLGLSVAASSAVRELFSADIEVEIPQWDRNHRVVARSSEQAQPFLRATVPAVMTAMKTLGGLVRWTDDEIAFERPVSVVEQAQLRETAAALAQLDATLADTPLPPPADLVVDLEDWRRLAKRLGGELTVGDLGIVGKLEQVPVDLGLEFDDARATRVRAYVGDPDRASEVLRAAELKPGQLPDWPSEFRELRLYDGVASACLPVDGRADANRVFELVTALRGVLASLDPAAGPYR